MQIFLTYIVDIHRNSQIFLWRCPKSWGYPIPCGGPPGVQYLAQAARVLTLNAASRSEMRPQSLMRMEAWRWNLAGYVQINRFYIYIYSYTYMYRYYIEDYRLYIYILLLLITLYIYYTIIRIISIYYHTIYIYINVYIYIYIYVAQV